MAASSRISIVGILMSHLVTFFSLFAYHVPNGLELIQINSTLLSVCILKQLNTAGKSGPAELAFAPYRRKGHCLKIFWATVFGPQVDRGFNLAFKEHADPYSKPVLHIMRKLSHEKKCIVFIGDSLMAQTLNAFLAELTREADLWNVTERPHRLQVEMKEPFKALKSTLFFEKYKWRNASILRFGHNRHDDAEAASKQFILETIRAECVRSPGFVGGSRGAVVLGNIGVHIESMRGVELEDRMRNEHRNIAVQVAFLETMPQHFDSEDGSYSRWTPTYYKTPNSWDPKHPLYHCRAVSNMERSTTGAVAHLLIQRLRGNHSSNRNEVEEEEEEEEKKKKNEDDYIGYIETFKYFNAFPLMHNGYCREDIRTVLQDCTHYCAFAPPMWMPIWSQLETFIRQP
eukprot:gene26877-35252_t